MTLLKTLMIMTKICRTTYSASRPRRSIPTESVDRATPPANAFTADSQGEVGWLDKLLCVRLCACVCQCSQQVHTLIAHLMHEENAHARRRR